MIDFFSNRQHITSTGAEESSLRFINASVIQGSGIGPSAFITNGSNLQPVNHQNLMSKYADDTYLLVGSNHRNTIATELAHINKWAAENNLKLNPDKTSEMIVSHQRHSPLLPPPLPGIKQVTDLKILGITLHHDLTITTHINIILESCVSSIYGLRVLRAHGIQSIGLQDVARATVVAKLLYASPAWWGLTNSKDRERLDRFVRKMKKMCFLPNNFPSPQTLAEQADDLLFKDVRSSPYHVLYNLLPPTQHISYNLRPRSHNFSLPNKDDTQFINRVLFKNINQMSLTVPNEKQ